ncbi:hormogonium polysaccharide secretion pseudopilin HpsC [Nodularia sp. NIES-3585]|uniref:hormogonium polysaccharide secretion pseudopilin HpsC n=1 Tax=Nodularia sp. NIES-3585 TaxID=1973477 RepID=UPI000B5CE10B|nr:hormogonium polysaccharide secretion pseudopilin HpsC [Nodularia sp. NIES-3585]
MRTLKFLLSNQLKRSKIVQPVSGFTLIELLVAMIISVLVITPLLGFMINILDTDRREQAKANSEQEIQSALDYISRDLQQAIYIYDADGIEAIDDEIFIPADGVPVLVFWKRELIKDAIPVGAGSDDSFVYSLVAYYLIKDSNRTWSNAARIARWQIKDGVARIDGEDGDSCGDDSDDATQYIICPSGGFAPFDLDGVGNLAEKMNSWEKGAGDFPASAVLVDFIDQTQNTVSGVPPVICPPNTLIPPVTWSQISPERTGFYACIDRVNTTAQVFLRGNALARLQSNNLDYTSNNSTYFPTASIRVQGRSFLFTQ